MINELAKKYYIDDIKSVNVPNTTISKAIKCIDKAEASNMHLTYLERNNLMALYKLAKGDISFQDYIPLAKKEQETRIENTKIKKIEEANKAQRIINERNKRYELERRQAKERQKALESDPKYIKKQQQIKLREKYDLGFYIEPEDYKRLIRILEIVDSGKRVKDEDWIWVEHNEEYCTDKLSKAYHNNEAMFFMEEYEKTKDLRQVVNASSHYRKGDNSDYAISKLSKINIETIKNMKLKSAFCTTYGGCKRDIEQFDDAIELAKKAHYYEPENYQPCTLLGAVFMETGSYELGREWYAKAVERGFKEKNVDNEIKSIFRKANKLKKESLGKYLLNLDSIRYHWVKTT